MPENPPSAVGKATELHHVRMQQVAGVHPGWRRPSPAPGTEDYIQKAVLVPVLSHIHEALTEALVKQTPGAVLTHTGSALRPGSRRI